MDRTLLHVRLKYAASESELMDQGPAFVELMRSVKGLIWKIWLINTDKKITGGVYLFEDKEAALDYVNGPVFQGVQSHPLFEEASFEYYGVMEEPSRATNAPVFD